MPINPELSTFSDWTFVTATAVYLIAMALIAVEQALSRVAAPAKSPALVTVGGGGRQQAVAMSTGKAGASRSWADRIGRMGVAQLVLGAVLDVASIALRGFSTGRWPLGNMYEYVMFITLVAVVTWLIILFRFPVRRMSVWVLLPISGLMVLDGKIFYAVAAPVAPPCSRTGWSST
jgi:hypothetical protein